MTFIKQLAAVRIKDVPEVGGKNASLGEMLQTLRPKGIHVPDGFVVTASAYRSFLKDTGLKKLIASTLKGLDTKNIRDLASRAKTVRNAIVAAKFPKNLERDIVKAYAAMEKQYGKNADVAVRSSATAEDLPGASFAGEHETYLNIRGKDEVLRAVKSAMASLFTDRAISYRVDKGFDHFKVALSVGVQKMVRSDTGCSGVMFTLDTESGFRDLVVVNGSWGLGEMIVQGEVTPDEFFVFKPNLKNEHLKPIISKKLGTKTRKMVYARGSGIKRTKIINASDREKRSFVLHDREILQLARWGAAIEAHYTAVRKKWTPMDIEWAKDGKTKELFIVQARPETIHADRDFSKVKEYLRIKDGKVVAKGASVGSKIASGRARVILSVRGIREFKAGEVLVTDMTDPDWEPIMKIAAAIVTDKGGRTSHAAIVSRELGIPCVAGSETATRRIKTGAMITVDTTSSEGLVLEGAVPFRVAEHDVRKIKKPKTKIAMNIATPDTAFEKSFLPNDGVGLAREEFIIASNVGIHPMALVNYDRLRGAHAGLKKIIDARTAGWNSKTQFYIDMLAYGIAKIGAAFYPKQVIVRFSDFKTNEYRQLLGGDLYEPQEENPMIGWRGASRYYQEQFAPAFALECRAVRKAREEMGLTNVEVMIPFCRTVEEGKKVLALMEKAGLPRKSGLKIYVMCEIPSNVILADEFLKVFDGMSIGSNDLTQLTVGIDRDGGGLIRGITDERDAAVHHLIAQVIQKCKKAKKYVGICGDAPSTFPEFAKFLVEEGIESMSLNPDVIVKTTMMVHELEKNLSRKK